MQTATGLSPAQVLQELAAGRAYACVHTFAFPSGEIRGALEPTGGTTLDATWAGVKQQFHQ
jgi:hypothetical protein